MSREELNQVAKAARAKSLPFWLCLICAIGLIVGGFFVPPMGVIDGSVLTAVGLLFGFAALAQVPSIIEAAGWLKITAGSVTIEAGDDNDN